MQLKTLQKHRGGNLERERQFQGDASSLFCTLENGYLWGHFPNNFQDRIWDRAMKIVLTCFALLICPLSAASAKGKHTNALNHQTYKKWRRLADTNKEKAKCIAFFGPTTASACKSRNCQTVVRVANSQWCVWEWLFCLFAIFYADQEGTFHLIGNEMTHRRRPTTASKVIESSRLSRISTCRHQLLTIDPSSS